MLVKHRCFLSRIDDCSKGFSNDIFESFHFNSHSAELKQIFFFNNEINFTVTRSHTLRDMYVLSCRLLTN